MKPYNVVLAIVGAVLQAMLAWILVTRRLWKFFRFFFIYTCFSVISTTATLWIRHAYPRTMFSYYSYWVMDGMYIILAFLCLYEVFYNVFRNFYDIFWFRMVFPFLVLAMLILAGVRAIQAPLPGFWRISRVILNLEIAVGFLQVGLFTLFILLVRLFRMRSRQYAFGIALGFGILAIGGLPSYLLLSEFGTKIQVIVYNAFPIVYIIAEMVWLLTFTRSEPPIQWQDSGSALDPEELITELRQYTRVAKGVLRR